MNEEIINKTYEEIAALKDLFLRRLMDDKVKMAAISQLKEENEELQKRLDEKNLSTFIKELLLVCDRIEGQEEVDDLTASVEEEILELLARREIYQMEPSSVFDPKYHNAVGTAPATDDYPDKSIVKIVRNGYLLRDQVFRPADVIVAVKTTTDND
jgi:molecular chaperone GrpE